MPATTAGRSRLAAAVHQVTRHAGLVALVQLGLVVAAGAFAWWAVRTFGRPYDFYDLRIYHGAVAWWGQGGELYEFVAPSTSLGFTYPPFAALLMLPMIFMTAWTAGWISTLAGITVLAFILYAIAGPIADRYGWPRWFAVGLAAALACATEPIRETLGYGQVNILLAGLIIADMIALRWRARARANPEPPAPVPFPSLAWLREAWLGGAFAGVGVGLATGIKLTPALFILYFVVTRQWRPTFVAVGTAIGASTVTYLVAEEESATYFGGVLWDTSRVGVTDITPNQSLAGLLARLYDSPVTPGLMWLAFAVLLLAVGLSRAKSAHADGDELTAFTLVGLTANAICPISWTHHMVFMIPALVILVDTALRRRRAVRGFHVGRFPALAGLRHGSLAVGLYALLVISPLWRYEHRLNEMSHYADGLYGALMENSLALAVIVLVVLLPWRPGAEPVFNAETGARRRRLTASF